MKNKYERLNKEEKKKVYNNYKKEKPILAKKFKNMYLLSYIGCIFGLCSFFYDYFISKSKLNYILDIIIFIFCIISIFIVNKVKKNILNNFLLKK